jgi:hypothetical protein
MSSFPANSMKAIAAKYPNAERFIQVRIFTRDGDIASLEGPCSEEQVRAVLGPLLGITPAPKVEK